MKNIKIIAAFVALFFAVQPGIAQQDSLIIKSDSVNANKLKTYNEKISGIENQRVMDSIQRVELEEKLNSLTTTDNLKKEELQKQIQALKNKEANRIAQKKAQIDSLRMTATGFPVLGFFNDTLFLIYSKLGSFSAHERAEAIHQRMDRLAGNYLFKSDSLKLEESETTVDIVFGQQTVMSVSENDAIWNSITKEELAEKYKGIIANEIVKYKQETSFVQLAKEFGLAIFVLLILCLLIYFIIRFFKWVAQKIQKQENKALKGVIIKGYTLFDAKREVAVLINVNTFLKWMVIILAIYIALPILFGIFPWTENLAQVLFGYILTPVKKIASGIWNYLPNLITIFVIIFVFRYVLKLLHFLKMEVEKGDLSVPGFYPDWANPTHQIIKVLVFAFMIIVIFPYLPGSDSPIFKGVSVFLGFLFTFGSAGSLSNIIAGLVLTYMRLFTIGDRVKIGDVMGDVIEKSLLVTRVRTIKNEIISIPNSTVMGSHTINYSSDAPSNGLIVHTTVTIGYDVPWRNMQQALIDAALKTDLILEKPLPFVLQTSLDDFYVSYQINAYTKEPNKQALIYSTLHQNIQDVCNERGIEILSPHYRAARDGSMSTIPSDYLPKDYKAPGFNFNVNKTDDV